MLATAAVGSVGSIWRDKKASFTLSRAAGIVDNATLSQAVAFWLAIIAWPGRGCELSACEIQTHLHLIWIWIRGCDYSWTHRKVRCVCAGFRLKQRIFHGYVASGPAEWLDQYSFFFFFFFAKRSVLLHRSWFPTHVKVLSCRHVASTYVAPDDSSIVVTSWAIHFPVVTGQVHTPSVPKFRQI